jgi:hypothetical protein
MTDPFAFSKGGSRGSAAGFGAAAATLAASAAEPWHPAAPLATPAPAGFGMSSLGSSGSSAGAAVTGSMGPMQMLPPQPRGGFQLPQQQQHQPQQAAAQPYAAAAAPSPASFAAPFAGDPMAQMGMAYGEKLLEGSIARSMPGVTSALASLRTYFAVNNHYVLKKLWVRVVCLCVCVSV